MTAVVQSVCPGCKTILHIPADWIRQPLRCKHCRLVMHAKGSPAPTPAPRKAAQAVMAAPAPAAPVAPTDTAALFADFGRPDADNGRAPSRRRRRGPTGGRWKGPAIALTVFAVAGLVLAVCWEPIKKLFPPAAPAVAEVKPADPPPKDNDSAQPVKPAKSKPQERTPAPPPRQEKPKPKPRPPPPQNDGPKKPGPKNDPVATRPDPPPPTPTPRPQAGTMPRRALVISLHNYLFANPVHYGIPLPRMIKLDNFVESLAYSTGLKVPPNQIFHLSDVAGKRGPARRPIKPAIETTLTSFLKTSRAQDRILVFFIGHSVEVGDKVYLVPIEGEMDNAATLIPLDWVLEQMQKCPARQKVLVLDVNRLNPTLGIERPASGPMGPKLAAAVKNPPPGVQVWAACSEKQQSYETDDSPMGVFIEELYKVLTRSTSGADRGSSKITRPDSPLPLEELVRKTNEGIQKELGPLKLTQVSVLGGKEPEGGAPYDAAEAPPAPPEMGGAVVRNDNTAVIQEVLKEISTPPIKVSENDFAVHYELLPPLPADLLQKYGPGGDPNSRLRKAVRKARAVLWAVASTGNEPADLADDIQKVRAETKVDLKIFKEGFYAPPAGREAQFKAGIKKEQEQVARILSALTEALEDLKAAGKARAKESKRWQANYDFIVARLEAQAAYVFEYDSVLGQMRKELPPRNPEVHRGWRLAAVERLKGDKEGRDLAKASNKQYDKLARDTAGSPWAILAKREKLTALGLQWQATK